MVGAINTGRVQQLDIVMDNVRAAGNEELTGAAARRTDLSARSGPAKLTMMLVYRTHDTFILSQPDVDTFLGDSGFATFAFGGDGSVSSVTLNEFGDADGGRFVVKSPS